jgi:metal-sulfur cluster biosynthetic enzyme
LSRKLRECWDALDEPSDPDTGKTLRELGLVETIEDQGGSIVIRMVPWAHDRHVCLVLEAVRRAAAGRPVEVRLDWDAKPPRARVLR